MPDTRPSPRRRPAVRTPRIARKRNPAAVLARDVALGALRFLVRDPLSTFLVIAATVLSVVFFTFLGDIGPSARGLEAPLSAVIKLSDDKAVSSARLLDHDSQLEIVARDGRELHAAYPASGAQTQQLIRTLVNNGATVTVDQQAGKPERQILIQFLLPILLLVCLFAFFMRVGADGGAGGIGGFSKFVGSGKRKGRGTADRVTFDDIAGVPEAVAELREIRDFLADPSKYLALGASAP